MPIGAAAAKSELATLASSSRAEFGRFRDVQVESEGPGGVLTLKIPLRKDDRPYFDGGKNGPETIFVDARIEPDGAWSPLELRPESTTPRVASALVPGEYPDGATLRLRIRAGKETSEALLEGLPRTRAKFDLSGKAQARLQPSADATLDAVAYHPRPRRADDMPVVGMLLRARLPQGPGVLWRLNKVSLETPFEPVKPDGFSRSSILRYELHPSEPTYMEERSTPFADAFPRIRVTGDLERCETRDETVDFGLVPTIVRGKTAYISPKGDVRRTLSDGRVVTLHPRDPKQDYPKDNRGTVASLSIEGGTPWPGEDEQVAVWMPPQRRMRTEFRPDGGQSQINLYVPPPKGPFRLKITRIRRMEAYPIDLNPTVQKVSFTALGSSRHWRSGYIGPLDAPRLALLPKE